MKRLLTVIVMMALMVSLTVPAFANDGTVTMYTTVAANAYALPRANSQVLAVLPAGTSVVTYPGNEQNGFTQCFTNETRFCYIPTVFLTTSSYNPIVPDNGERIVSGVTNYLAIRTEPARSDSNEIGKLYNGEKFIVSNYTNNGFAYGRSEWGQWGYVVADYLVKNGGGSTGGTTWYQGHDWSAVYNYDYYKNMYPDVVRALGTSPDALIAHFVNHGIYEGRQGRADWNVYTYMAQHPELTRIYGNNVAAYYKLAVGLQP